MFLPRTSHRSGLAGRVLTRNRADLAAFSQVAHGLAGFDVADGTQLVFNANDIHYGSDDFGGGGRYPVMAWLKCLCMAPTTKAAYFRAGSAGLNLRATLGSLPVISSSGYLAVARYLVPSSTIVTS